ncbi:MAG: hypothetical protein ACJ8FT_00185 [Sphingomonas sp.]
MAKKATGKSPGGKSKTSPRSSSKSPVPVERRSSGRGRRASDSGDMFIKLLQSPLVAELVAVAATSALAALAEHGFTSGGAGATRGKRAGKAVKEAGKAAAAAVGRRLGTEIDEIRKAAKGGAKA